MEWLYDWVWNLVVYFILVTAVTSVLPGETYKKYLRLFTGVVMILVMLNPILNILKLDARIEEVFRLERFEQERKELRANMEGMEAVGQEYVMSHYRELLTGQILRLAEEAGVSVSEVELLIEEDAGSGNYGRILYVTVRSADAGTAFAGMLSVQFGIPQENIRIEGS